MCVNDINRFYLFVLIAAYESPLFAYDPNKYEDEKQYLSSIFADYFSGMSSEGIAFVFVFILFIFLMIKSLKNKTTQSQRTAELKQKKLDEEKAALEAAEAKKYEFQARIKRSIMA